MQVCKCALEIIRGNVVFLLVYIVGLSFMGVFMAQGFDFGSQSDEFAMEPVDFAVIDRDGNDLSAGVAEFLEGYGERAVVEDESLAMQDAVAKGTTEYLLVIPEGFGEAFVWAARTGEESPKMDAVYSFYSMQGAFVDQYVNEFLGLARSLIVAEGDASQAGIVRDALALAQEKSQVAIIPSEGSLSQADSFVFYLQWSTYTLFAGIVVCIGVLTAAMGRREMRWRSLASPVSYASYHAQLALACGILMVAAWAWTFCLGMVAFPAAMAEISAGGLALCAVCMLAFCLSPLAVGLLLGQLGANVMVCNAVGNIVGMVVSFLGGAWVPLSLLSPEMTSLAHWLPGYWYTSACRMSAHLETADLATVTPILQCLGVLALFGVAVFCVSLLVGKLRVRTRS